MAVKNARGERYFAQIATPLRNPEEMFDDWNDSEVDKAYAELMR